MLLRAWKSLPPLARGIEQFWQAALQGVCGIKRIQSYDPSPYTTQIAGEITDLILDDLPQFNKTTATLRQHNTLFIVLIMRLLNRD